MTTRPKGATLLPTATAAQLAQVSAAINTTDKYAGKLVRDVTNNRIVFAENTGPTAKWWVCDGSISITPA